MPQELYFASPSTRSSSLWVVSSPDPTNNTQIASNCNMHKQSTSILESTKVMGNKYEKWSQGAEAPFYSSIRWNASLRPETIDTIDQLPSWDPLPVPMWGTKSACQASRKRPLTVCYMLQQVCHFNWFGRLVIPNQCPKRIPLQSPKHLPRLNS